MPIDRDLLKTLRQEALSMGREEGRALVDMYYQIQDKRLASGNQRRAIEQQTDSGPVSIHAWLYDSMMDIENRIKDLLGRYAAADPVGAWSQSICGIGPVMSAGLLAHIDITKAPTAGSIWRFAGLDPTLQWNKGEKRPFNADLKVLAFKLGDSFIKVSSNDNDVYGHLIQERMQYEHELNASGAYAEQAAAIIEARPNHKQAATYKEGMLPDGHIFMRAKRWGVKLFLAHYHEVAYWAHYGSAPPAPYIFEHGEGQHVHRLDPPNWQRPTHRMSEEVFNRQWLNDGPAR